MAITNEQQTEILKIVAGLFNAAPGGTNLTELANLVSGGMTTSQLADALAAHSLFTGTIMAGKVTTSAQVAVLMNNFGLTADSDPASAGSQAQAYFTQQINSGVGFGKIVFDTVTYLSGSPAPEFITVATLLSNKALVAAAYSESNSSTSLTTLQNILANVTGTAAYTDQDIQDILDATSGTNVGQTFTLTTGTDKFTGNSGADTFDASLNANGSQTYTDADSVIGGDGRDTLNVNITTAGSGTFVPAADAFSGIEVINVSGAGAATFNFANVTGITNANNAANSANVTFRNIDPTVAVKIANTTAHTTTVDLKTSALTGSADTLNVELQGVTGSVTVRDVTLSASDSSALETLNISTSNTASTVTTLTVTTSGVTKIAIAGDQDLTVTNFTDGTAAGVAAKTIDASALTGNLSITGVHNTLAQAGNTITGGSGGDTLGGGAGNDVISGGAGNDSITASTGNDSLSGGAGNDTFDLAGNLTIDDTIAGGDNTDVLKVTAALTGTGYNISGIETVETSGAVEISAAAVPGVTTLRSTQDATGTTTFSNLVGTETIDIRTATGSNDNVTATKAVDGNADSQTVTIGNSSGATAVALGTLTLNDAETISITSSLVANSIGVLTSSDATKLNVAGSTGLTISAFTGSTQLKTIDASSMTASFIQGAAIGTSGVTITGGSANDTLIGSAGNDSISGGAGADQIQLGGAGGNDFFSGGDGNDTFLSLNALTSDITANDTISGGTGTDTIQFGDAASAGQATYDLTASGILGNVSSIEKIILQDGTQAVTLTVGDDIVGIAGNALTISANQTGRAATIVNNTLSSTATVTTTQDVAGQVLTYTLGNSIDKVTGNTAADVFIAGTTSYLGANDVIQGGSGADTLRFTSTTASQVLTAAQLAGVSGVETLNVVTGTTNSFKFTLNDSVAGANFSGTSFTVSRAAEAGTLEVQGGSVSYALVLSGGTAADTLVGGSGNDTITGGATADDSLTGGAGNDSFTLGITTNDTITDFNFGTSSTGVDVIKILSGSFAGATLSGETLNIGKTGSAAGDYSVVVLTGASYATVALASAAANVIDNSAANEEIIVIYQNDLGNVTIGYDADADTDGTAAETIIGTLSGISITGVASLIDASDFLFSSAS